ncbi:flagellar biosynthetic protein FliO [Thermovenabulum sp.]|uniref:flagellar biosynthetic protein FliO n=1 Tax=Thermovenabulum sp. TaxID=3100335 RepID=UPI003C7E1446
MKSRFIIVLFLMLTVLSYNFQIIALPNSGQNYDIKNLEKYNFDNPDSQKTSYSSFYSAINLLAFIILFSIVCILAFYFTRFLSLNKSFFQKSKYMEIIDVLSLGNKTNLYIVKLPSGYYILGNNEKGISVISQLGEREIELIKEAENLSGEMGKKFASQLELFIKRAIKSFGAKNGDDKK